MAVAPAIELPLAGPPDGRNGPGLRAAGIVAAAVGGAGLLAGLMLNLKANSLADEMMKTDQFSEGKASDRDTYETASWTSYGVGGACFLAGVVLYGIGSRPGQSMSSGVTIAPAYAPGRAVAVVRGAF